MSILITFRSGARVALVAVLGLTLVLAVGCKKPSPPPVATKVRALAKTNTVAMTDTDLSAYASTFEDLPPNVGKDPFFPSSHRRDPASVQIGSALLKVDPVLVLKGIVGSQSHRLAVINNEILEVGEESPVRVPNGHVRVKCLEIGEDYVVVKVEGEAETKRLAMDGNKK
jgi:hypothetical protein